MSETQNTSSLPDDLLELFEQSKPLEPQEVEFLRAEASALDEDPGFRADYLKQRFVELVQEAMHEQGQSQSQLAKLWDKSRQYVSRLFKTDRRMNFTIESMAQLTALVGRKLDILVMRPGEQAHVHSCRMEVLSSPVAHRKVEPVSSYAIDRRKTDRRPANVLDGGFQTSENLVSPVPENESCMPA